MSYQITLSNGTILVTIAENVLDHSTSLTLVGKNYLGYGAALADNFVHLLENSAKSTAPVSPLVGQLWYDSANLLMKVWNGTAWASLVSGVASVAGRTGAVVLSNADVSGSAPLASPTFTGSPRAPTPASGSNTTLLATTQFVTSAVAAGPSTFPTLNVTTLTSRSVTIDGTGPWSGHNVGRQLLITTSFNNNPGIGIADHQNDNLCAIYNASGGLYFSGMPAYNVGVGTDPVHRLILADGDTTLIGTLEVTGVVTSAGFSVVSDRRLKRDITPTVYGLSEIQRLKPVTFHRVNEESARELGFIAQEVGAIIPEAVMEVEFPTSHPNVLAVRSDAIIAALVAAVQTLSARVETLEAKLGGSA